MVWIPYWVSDQYATCTDLDPHTACDVTSPPSMGYTWHMGPISGSTCAGPVPHVGSGASSDQTHRLAVFYVRSSMQNQAGVDATCHRCPILALCTMCPIGLSQQALLAVNKACLGQVLCEISMPNQPHMLNMGPVQIGPIA